MPNEEDWVRLEKSRIYLAPTTKQPKVTQSEAVEIARKRVKGIDPALTNPPPTHRYATNYAVGPPEEPGFMRVRLVWVVSFRIVNVVVGGDEAVDAPPNKTPRKDPTTAHVLVDSQTGEYILTVLAGERPEYVINLVCEPGVIETARKRWDAADVSSYDVVLQVRVFGPDAGDWQIQVRDGEVVGAERGEESRSPRQSPEETLKAAEQFTIEALFERVAWGCKQASEAAHYGDIHAKANFDPDRGYPVSYSYDWISAMDDEYYFEVTSFKVVN